MRLEPKWLRSVVAVVVTANFLGEVTANFGGDRLFFGV